MRTRLLARLAILGMLLVHGLAAAAAAEPPKYMHNSQAGKPGKDGWITAKSTYGDFVIRVPFVYDDFSATDPPTGVTYHEVDAFNGAAKFTARRGPLPGGGKDPEEFFTKRLKEEKSNVLESSRLKYRGYPAMEITVAIRKEKGVFRFICVEEELIVLLAGWTDATQFNRADIDKFFNSLKISNRKN